MLETAEYFDQLLSLAKKDDKIIGLFLGGSRGKGFEDASSDYDIYIIVQDKVVTHYKTKYPKYKYPGLELMVYSLKEFTDHANWQSETRWNRYNFAYLEVLVDKTGQVQKMINEKGGVPKKEQKQFISHEIDCYLNHFIRPVRAYERGDTIGFRLSPAYFINHLMAALFALEGRMLPYCDYLARELKVRPLKNISWKNEKLLKTILNILDGNLPAMQELAKEAKKVFCAAGYTKVYKKWHGKDEWAINFKPIKK